MVVECFQTTKTAKEQDGFLTEEEDPFASIYTAMLQNRSASLDIPPRPPSSSTSSLSTLRR